MGYLAGAASLDERHLRRAMIYGTITASFACESFSVERLRSLTDAHIATRFGGARGSRADRGRLKRVLFISGSVGLGHATRDLAIAAAMRVRRPGIEILWLAAQPASRAIEEAGERLLPEAGEFVEESAIAERTARGGKLNLIRYAFEARKSWSRNIDILTRVTRRERFDLVIGDETYEMSLAFRRDPRLKTCPFVMIFDFVGFDPVSWNPIERLGVYLWNWAWSGGRRPSKPAYDLGLFIGEIEDVPDRSFGFRLPNRRTWAKERYRFVGHVFSFESARYADRDAVRSRLGYGAEPLVICSIGGTAIGRKLLDLCGAAYPILRRGIPDLRMILVSGPRIGVDELSAPEGVEMRGYVPALYEHFAAADLAIVQAAARRLSSSPRCAARSSIFPSRGTPSSRTPSRDASRGTAPASGWISRGRRRRISREPLSSISASPSATPPYRPTAPPGRRSSSADSLDG